MADYVIPGGRFVAVADDLLVNRGFGITWYDRFVPSGTLYPVADAAGLPGLCAQAFEVAAAGGVDLVHKPSSAGVGARTDRSNRVKYRCAGCGLNVWGKPGIRVACMTCAIELKGVLAATERHATA